MPSIQRRATRSGGARARLGRSPPYAVRPRAANHRHTNRVPQQPLEPAFKRVQTQSACKGHHGGGDLVWMIVVAVIFVIVVVVGVRMCRRDVDKWGRDVATKSLQPKHKLGGNAEVREEARPPPRQGGGSRSRPPLLVPPTRRLLQCAAARFRHHDRAAPRTARGQERGASVDTPEACFDASERLRIHRVRLVQHNAVG